MSTSDSGQDGSETRKKKRREFLKTGALIAIPAAIAGVGSTELVQKLVFDPANNASWQKKVTDSYISGVADGYASGVKNTIAKIGIKTYGQDNAVLGTNLNQQREHLEPLRLYGQVLDDFCLLLLKCVNIRQRCETDEFTRNGVLYLIPDVPKAIEQAKKVEAILTGQDPGISVWNALDMSIAEADTLGGIAVTDLQQLSAAVKADATAIATWNKNHEQDNGVFEGSGTLFYTYKDFAESLLKKNPDGAIPILEEQSGATIGYKSVLLGGKLVLIRDLDFSMKRFLQTYKDNNSEWDVLTWPTAVEAIRSIIRYDPTDQYLAGWCEQKADYIHGSLKNIEDELGDFGLPLPHPESIHPRYRKAFKNFYNSLKNISGAQDAVSRILAGQLPDDAIMELQNAVAKIDVISATKGYETSVQKRIERFMNLGGISTFDELMLALRDRTQAQQYGDLYDQFHPWFVPETSPIIPKNYANLTPEGRVKGIIANAKDACGFDKRYNNAMGISGACAAENMTYYLGDGQKKGFIGWLNMISGAAKAVKVPVTVIRSAESFNAVRGGLVLNDSNGNMSMVYDWDKDDGWSASDYMSKIVFGHPAFTHGPFMNSSRMYQLFNFK